MVNWRSNKCTAAEIVAHSQEFPLYGRTAISAFEAAVARAYVRYFTFRRRKKVAPPEDVCVVGDRAFRGFVRSLPLSVRQPNVLGMGDEGKAVGWLSADGFAVGGYSREIWRLLISLNASRTQ